MMGLFRRISLGPGFWLVLAGLLFSGLFGAFGVNNYRSARPIAEGTLRGLALSLASTFEALANQDPSLALLRRVSSPDIAFYAVSDPAGLLLFHSNPDLVGTLTADDYTPPAFTARGFWEGRIVLGTGEEVYEFLAPLHLPDRQLIQRLVLHTYQADAVVRRARNGLVVLGLLLAAGWGMGIVLYLQARRAARHRREMARQQHLAQLGTLGAVLAHEVRNPLSGIKGYAQLLEETLGHEEQRQFARQVVTESVRLEELVNDLLAYAQPSLPRVAPVALPALAREVLALVEGSARAAGVRLEGGEEESPPVLADADRLRQVLLNLLVNAVQATAAGGEVRLTARERGGWVELRVSDTGKGIAAEDLPRIFEPFFTRRARGTGLGLAICKKYLDEMHGTLTVESVPGQGSVFTLALPTAKRSGE